MSDNKIKLPALIKLEDFNGDAKVYIENAYSIFERDFIKEQPVLFGKKVIIGKQKKENGKEMVFWHITSNDFGANYGRLPDMRRFEKIEWVAFVIKNISKIDGLLYWDKQQKRAIRTYIYLEKDDFLIILEKTKRFYILITAFHVSYKGKKKQLLKDYKKAKSAH